MKTVFLFFFLITKQNKTKQTNTSDYQLSVRSEGIYPNVSIPRSNRLNFNEFTYLYNVLLILLKWWPFWLLAISKRLYYLSGRDIKYRTVTCKINLRIIWRSFWTMTSSSTCPIQSSPPSPPSLPPTLIGYSSALSSIAQFFFFANSTAGGNWTDQSRERGKERKRV